MPRDRGGSGRTMAQPGTEVQTEDGRSRGKVAGHPLGGSPQAHSCDGDRGAGGGSRPRPRGEDLGPCSPNVVCPQGGLQLPQNLCGLLNSPLEL